MKMQKHGNLFVFEGPDNSGKTTLSRALVDCLKGQNIDCAYLAFPGHETGTLGKLVYDLHHDPQSVDVEFIGESSLQLLHVAAHIDLIESKILTLLRNGTHVILDRFWWSTWVYGRVRGANRQSLEAMISIENASWEGVRPAMVFLPQGIRVINDSDHFQDQLINEYRSLAILEDSKYPVKWIDNAGTIDEALLSIIHNVNSVLSQQPISKESETIHKQFYQNSLPLDYSKMDSPNLFVFSKLSPAKHTVVYDTYWRFAVERQAIFFRRLANEPPPWTQDSIFGEYKFTNAYRASDRVSQYLIKHVIYEGDQSIEEVFFRILLFKIFNKIETWQLLFNKLGGISFADYSFKHFDEVLTAAGANGTPIYSAAYIMPSGGPSSIYDKKHRMHLKLLEGMMQDELPDRLANTSSMKKAFEMLRAYPTIGDFLAYQYVTDLNYSTIMNFSEMEFVIPGPGARDGIRKCFRDLGGLNESDIIKVVTNRQQEEFKRLNLQFQSLWGRPLQLIDCQNLFCEVDKYARVKHPKSVGITGRTRIKQKYRMNPKPFQVWYPPKWGLNEAIAVEREYVSSI